VFSLRDGDDPGDGHQHRRPDQHTLQWSDQSYTKCESSPDGLAARHRVGRPDLGWGETTTEVYDDQG
jgi:hypothetical protein